MQTLPTIEVIPSPRAAARKAARSRRQAALVASTVLADRLRPLLNPIPGLTWDVSVVAPPPPGARALQRWLVAVELRSPDTNAVADARGVVMDNAAVACFDTKGTAEGLTVRAYVPTEVIHG